MSFNSKYKSRKIEEILDSVEDKQDKLVSGTNIKTINGTSLLGSGDIEISGGEGGAGVYITPFTVEQFCNGWVELTDEQCNELINAASQNRIIGMPYEGEYQVGYIVANFTYKTFDDEGLNFWSLTLGVIYNSTYYINTIGSNIGIAFNPDRLSAISFNTNAYGVIVEDGVAYVQDESGFPDNCIFWVRGECTELYIYLEPSEIGKTVRFFTGESCTLEIGYSVYWANGEVPTIEPYTHYELSLVTNMEGEFNAVLTPFKPVE